LFDFLIFLGIQIQSEYTRNDVLNIWIEESGTLAERFKNVLDALIKDIRNKGYEPNLEEFQTQISYICKKLASFWQIANWNKERFLNKNSDWLECKETIIIRYSLPLKATNNSRGRPKKDFADISNRTKRRRIAEVAIRNESAASLLRISDLQGNKSISEPRNEEVLALFMECQLTKHQYLMIRSFINSKLSYEMLPSYDKILSAKQKSYLDICNLPAVRCNSPNLKKAN